MDTIAVIFLVLLVVFVITGFVIIRLNRHNDDNEPMEGHEFEHYCARLLADTGFDDVSVTRGSGDYGVDILAQKDMVTYAIQCKSYNEYVGVKAVMEVYAGCAYYDRMVPVVMTNSFFTEPAQKMADKLKVLLWDGNFIEDMWENR